MLLLESLGVGFLAGVEVGVLKTVNGNKNSYSIDIYKLTVQVTAFFDVHTNNFFFFKCLCLI